jgi:hypothetical protein
VLRRQRLRTAAAALGLVVFTLVGGTASYFWVNGMPGRGGGAQPAASPAPPAANAASPAREG